MRRYDGEAARPAGRGGCRAELLVPAPLVLPTSDSDSAPSKLSVPPIFIGDPSRDESRRLWPGIGGGSRDDGPAGADSCGADGDSPSSSSTLPERELVISIDPAPTPTLLARNVLAAFVDLMLASWMPSGSRPTMGLATGRLLLPVVSCGVDAMSSLS